MDRKFIFSVLACLAAISSAQNTTGKDKSACMCLCCNYDIPASVGMCGIPGAYQVDTCDECTDENIAVYCPLYFPDLCPSYQSVQQCGPTEIDSDWTGDWVVDPCSACLLDEKNQPVGDCLPCCDSDNCDCIYGTVTISHNGTLYANGTAVQQLQMNVSGIKSQTFPRLANQTGTTGNTATVNVSDIYDLIKDGDHIRFMNRRLPGCNVAATRNPPTTSILKLVLLLGGAGIVALACIVFCCCNPCAKKKPPKDTALLEEEGQGEEGQTEGVPPAYAPVHEAGGINYIGKPNAREL